jgi:long-chain fatty acid transport protein
MKLRLVLVLVCLPSLASAGGMFLPGRGARPLGRAGAFVAGADDGGAIYYNPAGLADIDGVSLLLDASLIFQQVDYNRVDSGGNQQPRVSGSMNLLPIPTLALTWKPKKASWLTIAGGVWVPNIGVDSFPQDGPQRYSSITINGSLLMVAELAAAFRIHEHFWLGVGFETMYFKFHSRKMLSSCPSQVDCAPEDPSFDSLTELDATSAFTPSGIIGATVAYPQFRIGLSIQLPFWVRAEGTVRARLPTNPMFDGSNVVGQSVSVSFDLPLEARLGVEYRPKPYLRVELDGVFENWAMQDKLTIQPHGIYIDDVPGIGKYYLPTLYENRRLNNVYSLRIGAEWEALKNRLWARLGYLFESSAAPDTTAGVLTPDGTHNMLATGISVKAWKLRIDFGYAHIFTSDRTVDYRKSQAYQINPIQPGLQVGVGGGRYHISDDLIALGFDGRF